MKIKILIYTFILLIILVEVPVWAQKTDAKTNTKTDQPQSGEGLGAFLLRNGYNISQYKDEFIELNKNKLGKDNQLKLGISYTFPQKRENVKYEPLLGKAEENVKITSHTLKGATYYLVSGHGGPDPGAMGKLKGNDLCEDEYAYDIILRLARQLLQRDANVHIIIQDPNDGIRDTEILKLDEDETCEGREIPLDQIKRLRQRVDAINNHYKTERKGYCRAIFIHLDSRSQDKRIDIFLYHYMKSVLGERLANKMRDKFEAKYKQHQPKRGFTGTVSERGLYVLKESNPPCVFLELGNLQNELDQTRFTKVDNREAIARWMAEAIEEDYVNNKK